eukprot:CAMPEP_0181293508 /NCGR_PEP_ID=MMETSP1101-20121128/3103_1 /TAXON_ID=46948 /ORGANISM="Rhodomonas abbreviata, Strain Caron Lab Isolate" /LENGTH=221 /DNA_ID=CAMNT_0023398101 /DNA_START=269 /DNA_END=934 /DNA_ORIENTATION=+
MQLRWCLAFLVLVALTGSTFADEDDEGEEYALVTCGSAVKLQHIQTRFRLHSHDIKWGSGSAQQSVTAVSHKDDPNSLWKVSGAHGESCPQGAPVKHGQVVRLTHVQTKRNLHSHLYQSPLSKQQEVSCFGDRGKGDTGDNWVVQVKDGDYWKRGKRVRFMHKDTRAYLHTHTNYKFDQSNCGQNCPIGGQQEVTAYPQADDELNFWKTAEGIYFPVQKDA